MIRLALLAAALASAFIAGGNVALLTESCGGYTVASVIVEATAFAVVVISLTAFLVMREPPA